MTPSQQYCSQLRSYIFLIRSLSHQEIVKLCAIFSSEKARKYEKIFPKFSSFFQQCAKGEGARNLETSIFVLQKVTKQKGGGGFAGYIGGWKWSLLLLLTQPSSENWHTKLLRYMSHYKLLYWHPELLIIFHWVWSKSLPQNHITLPLWYH